MDTRHVLFERFIDDAGLFPPARKPMASAVGDHMAARAGATDWMLGRFLCPVSQLNLLTDETEAVPDIGAVLDAQDENWLAGVRADLETLSAWRRCEDVSAAELRLPVGAEGADLQALARMLSDDEPGRHHRTFLEITSWDPAEVRSTLAGIARMRLTIDVGAKLRCGGVTAEAVPPAETVAAFVEGARGLHLPFKATAGLHHPFRVVDESTGALQHGFVNLLAATALPSADPVAVIQEADPEAFSIDARGLTWRGAFAGVKDVKRARTLFTAFGSCSFAEPVEDLLAYGMIDAVAPV